MSGGPRLLVASGNAGKLREFREALASSGLEVVGAGDVGIRSFPPELGGSYEENALLKAGYATLRAGLPALADDSGLEVDALGGAPGIHSARFGGNIGDGERMALLLDRLRGAADDARGARFVCSIVFAAPSGEVRVFAGECRGTILRGPRGSAGFGYDPLFFSEELGKTFAEAALEEKRRVSHRGRALRKFAEWLAGPEGRALTGSA